MVNEEKKESILSWIGSEFPLEVREEAALIYADYVRKIPNSQIDFYTQKLTFGTGGMRGVIGNGAGRMNRWTVGKVSLGLARLLKQKYSRPALVIAYDSRHMSYDFAQVTAGIAIALKIKVYIFREVAPTPILSYAVRKLHAHAGVVITASHNPPEYNGYKVYADDGAQIVGEDQTSLEKAIQAIQSWSEIHFLSPDDPIYKKNIHKIGSEIRKFYTQEIAKESFVTSVRNPKKSSLKIVYTPLHGTGGPWLPVLLRHFGFDVDVVPEQAKPDGNFPTVKYPNPEEVGALELAEVYARKIKADLILATDPDADRLGIGVRDVSGKYTYFNGNQIGSLMCAFLCENFPLQAEGKKNTSVGKIFKTIVTTDLQRRIAEAHSVEIHEVLTGFKYIAEQMRVLDHKKSHKRYVFGGEESYGYLPINFVRDKDALSSALLLCEMLAEVTDIHAYMNQVCLRYGLYLEDLKSITLKGLEGQVRIQAAMESLRKEDFSKWYLGKRKVIEVRDFQKHLRNGKYDPGTFSKLPYSNVIQFLLEPEGKLTIRPSGTEPKIKLYASLRYADRLSNVNELENAKKKLEDELTSTFGQFMVRAGLSRN